MQAVRPRLQSHKSKNPHKVFLDPSWKGQETPELRSAAQPITRKSLLPKATVANFSLICHLESIQNITVVIILGKGAWEGQASVSQMPLGL